MAKQADTRKTREVRLRPLIGICSRPGYEAGDISAIGTHYANAVQEAGPAVGTSPLTPLAEAPMLRVASPRSRS